MNFVCEKRKMRVLFVGRKKMSLIFVSFGTDEHQAAKSTGKLNLKNYFIYL
jgi:hypothetical protein